MIIVRFRTNRMTKHCDCQYCGALFVNKIKVDGEFLTTKYEDGTACSIKKSSIVDIKILEKRDDEFCKYRMKQQIVQITYTCGVRSLKQNVLLRKKSGIKTVSKIIKHLNE